MKTTRTFTRGRMNKELDERLIPDGEYIHAENITVGSTEQDEMGVVENARANELLVTPRHNGIDISNQALCIGTFADEGVDEVYWFVHDPAFTGSAVTGKLDLVLSYNSVTGVTTYHLVSMNDGGGVNTTLNFNPAYLITGVDKIDDLFFFTDNYNAPRRINLTTGYGIPAGGIDTFTNEEILVIKKPPSESPKVETEENPNLSSNYMEERFLCFGYRWRYDDNEYSATSQFSNPAFVPKEFDFSAESLLNEGMVNKHNRAKITFKTGSELVKGIDVLFKDGADPTIKIIEKLDKNKLGIPDNNDYTIDFSDSKIFTVLPETEILRLYDNVPRLAQASTIMGNRLMYGNYLEGYDLKDLNGNPTRLLYHTSRRSLTFGSADLESTALSFSTTTYTINPAVTTNLANSSANFDFFNVATDALGNSNFTAGTTLSFTFEFEHRAFTTDPAAGSTPAQENVDNAPFTLNFEYTLPTSYTSLADVIASPAWSTAIGTATTIKPIYDPGNPTSCDGITFTDDFNCELQDLGAFTAYASGITGDGQPIETSVLPNGFTLRFSFPALRLVDNPAAITKSVYELFGLNSIGCTMTSSADRGSLHSNRGYETAIVYMDDYNRSTTALVSPTNTIHVPCRRSNNKNLIRATIPTGQLAPAWATRYKFVVKPDREKFDTIYSNIAFIEAGTSNKAYILLEGENAQKVKEGDRLIVKRDMSGALNTCVYVTVLEKKAISAEEAEVIDPDGLMTSGTYMVIKDSTVDFEMDSDSVVDFGWLSEDTECDKSFTVIWYPVNYISGSTGEDYTIPTNSRIKLEFEIEREGRKTGALCGNYEYVFSETFVSNNNYDNFRDWWDDSNIGGSLNTGSWGDTDPDEEGTVTYFDGLATGSLNGSGACCDHDSSVGDHGGQRAWGKPDDNCDIYSWLPWMTEGAPADMFFRFIREGGGTNDPLYLGFRGGKSCGSKESRKADSRMRIRVIRANNLFVFETEPQDANPDLFYEGSQSYSIDTATGRHNGNVQNQTASQPAIIDLDFRNCYSFGNGVESYKIRDSIVGKEFLLGNRATSTAAKDFKEVRRGADITYSGVYNQESNVNKTNEFNLGVLNFKPLEQLFGSIQKMFARETDVLVLQQNKISYVLAGKNLLSDAAGGGTIASVPEVLGTQIARIETYGISDNPESFANYGKSRYFTDTARGAVIQLTGTAGANETLTAISDANMSTWFRDAFNSSVDTQKLGGYDPYSDEYVLALNNRMLPMTDECLECGQAISISLNASNSFVYRYCVDVGAIAENFTIDYDWNFVGAGETFEVSVVYDGVTTTTGAVSTAGSLTVVKTDTKPTEAAITVTSTTQAIIYATVNCPIGTELTVTQVCITSQSDEYKLIHNEMFFTQGGYVSPTLTPQIQFSGALVNPVVSQYQSFTGFQGEFIFPSDGSTVTVQSNKYGTDDFVVSDPPDKMSYLRTNTVYPNTPTGITSLLAAATNIPLSGTSPVVGGTFTMPAGTDTQLYLIYDYRDKQSSRPLCYDAKVAPGGIEDACCGCTPSGTYYLNGPNLATSTGVYTDSTLVTGAANGFYQENGIVREQTGAPGLPILGPAQSCPTCLPVCSVDTATLNLGDGGIYKMDYQIGSGTGAIIIKYTPNSIPNGIKARYNAVNYFKLSSQNFGKLESTASNYTLCGTTPSACISTYPDTSSYNVYEWNNGNWLFNATPQNATVAAGDDELTATSPGNCVMVVPKPLAAPANIDIEILTPCIKDSTTWQIEVICPAPLPAVTTTAVEATHLGACGAALGTSHYFVRTDGTTTGPELHAFVFTDVNGATPAADGYIKYTGPQSYQIQDGIIIAITAC